MNEEWVSQIKRGTLEYAILLLIRSEDRYGYDLIQSMEKFSMLKTQESTVYPLLRRLLKSGYLDSYWKNTEDGVPPRKYYKMTDQGRRYLEGLDQSWQHLTDDIDRLRGKNHG